MSLILQTPALLFQRCLGIDQAADFLEQVLRTVEVVRAQYLAEPPIEALDHAVGLRCPGLGQPVFNAQCLAQLIEPVRPCGLTQWKAPLCHACNCASPLTR